MLKSIIGKILGIIGRCLSMAFANVKLHCAQHTYMYYTPPVPGVFRSSTISTSYLYNGVNNTATVVH